MAMSSGVLRSISGVLHLRGAPRRPLSQGRARAHTVLSARDYWIYAAAPAA